MKLVFTYVGLTPGIGIPADRFLRSAMQPLKDRFDRVVCDKAERIRVELIVEDGSPVSFAAEQDGREIVARCFVDVGKYKTLKSDGRAQLLAEAAEKAVIQALNDFDCI